MGGERRGMARGLEQEGEGRTQEKKGKKGVLEEGGGQRLGEGEAV